MNKTTIVVVALALIIAATVFVAAVVFVPSWGPMRDMRQALSQMDSAVQSLCTLQVKVPADRQAEATAKKEFVDGQTAYLEAMRKFIASDPPFWPSDLPRVPLNLEARLKNCRR